MLSIEKIENIIKSKYNDLLKHKNIADTFKNFEFDIQRNEEFDYKIWKEITLFFDKKEKLYYEEKSKHDGDYFYTIKKFEIENNAIELKHYLDIEITQQDIIDWIKTFKSYHNTLKTHIVIKYLYISINDKKEQYFYIKENRKSLSFYTYENFDKKSVNIFAATNSNEYWKLYNIIKNLKE